jgi:hypothetical protein
LGTWDEKCSMYKVQCRSLTPHAERRRTARRSVGYYFGRNRKPCHFVPKCAKREFCRGKARSAKCRFVPNVAKTRANSKENSAKTAKRRETTNHTNCTNLRPALTPCPSPGGRGECCSARLTPHAPRFGGGRHDGACLLLCVIFAIR